MNIAALPGGGCGGMTTTFAGRSGDCACGMIRRIAVLGRAAGGGSSAPESWGLWTTSLGGLEPAGLLGEGSEQESLGDSSNLPRPRLVRAAAFCVRSAGRHRLGRPVGRAAQRISPHQDKAKPPRCRSYARVSGVIVTITLVAPTGVDPVTSRFSVERSTN